MDTATLIERCKKKERKAEKALFLRLAPILLTDCRRYATDDSEAKDFLQDAFIRIYNKLHLFDLERGSSIEAWARTLTRNNTLMLLRKRKHMLSIIPLDQIADQHKEPDHNAFDLVTEEDLIASIQKLPVGYRTILNMFVFEGMTHEDISKSLSISSGTSRSQFARAKKALKQILLDEKKVNYEWREREAL